MYYPGTQLNSVDQAGLDLDPFVSPSQVLGLKTWANMPGFRLLSIHIIIMLISKSANLEGCVGTCF